MIGALDVTSRTEAFAACCNCVGFSVVLDLGELTFMDPDGYAAIIDAIRVLGTEGRGVTIRGIQGQPQRLVVLMGAPSDIWFEQSNTRRTARSMSTGY
jgi:anti-anti-sigma regulatory factor